MHYTLCIRFHKWGLAMAPFVELEADGIVGANLCAVEATCAAGIVDETLLYFYAF